MLKGYKTYIFILLLLGMFAMDSQGLIPEDAQPYKKEVYAALAAGAALSLRSGIKSDAKDEAERIVYGGKK